MADSSPDAAARGRLAGLALLAGAALGTLTVVGAGVLVRDAEGVTAAWVGVLVTTIAALAIGLWVGAPLAAEDDPRIRGRWLAAGVFTGAAGLFATLWEVLPAVRQEAVGQALALLLLVAVPVYSVGMLLPALLAWAEQRVELPDDADAWRWEPLGTISLGVLFGTALGMMAAAVVLVPYLGAGPALFGTGAALILPATLVAAPPVDTDEQVIYATETPLGEIRVVEIVHPGQRQPERRLYVNGEEESGESVRSGAPTLPYIAAAERWLAETAAAGDRYLFLGGGAYTLPRRVAERDPQATITVVELDPEVTQVAYRFFGVRRGHGIRSVHGDARAFLERAQPGSFERIFVDVYAGQEALPYSLVTREAFELAARALAPGGMVTVNAIGVTDGPGALRLWSIVRTATSVLPSIALYVHLGRDYPDRQNLLLAGCAEPGYEFPPRAGLFEPWPRAEWPELEGVTVFRDLELRRAQRGPASDAEPAQRAARD